MKIGIDFDNTIVCYNEAFFKAALKRHLIPTTIHPSKKAIRDYLRSMGKEKEWTLLQGYVYGSQMNLATPYSGVTTFFQRCQALKISPIIISHKTKHPYLGPSYNLHEAAKQWLANQPFKPTAAYFELTLGKKLHRISQLKCDYFIDDLLELLTEKSFPPRIKKVLFDPDDCHSSPPNLIHCSSWEAICQALLT